MPKPKKIPPKKRSSPKPSQNSKKRRKPVVSKKKITKKLPTSKLRKILYTLLIAGSLILILLILNNLLQKIPQESSSKISKLKESKISKRQKKPDKLNSTQNQEENLLKNNSTSKTENSSISQPESLELPQEESLPPNLETRKSNKKAEIPTNQEQAAVIAIIVDDCGYPGQPIDDLLSLQPPVTLAVLPFTPLTKRICTYAEEHNLEILLHMPMEPIGYPTDDPGAGALFVDMTEAQIRKNLQECKKEVPCAVGVNNHMGSRFTSDYEATKIALEEIQNLGLFFIDSYTSANSEAYHTALEIGLPSARRDIFLDNSEAVEEILIKLEELKKLAFHKGAALGIAHAKPNTIKALKEFLAALNNNSNGEFHLITVQEFIQEQMALNNNR